MAPIPHVQPGDLIRATDMNALIDIVNALEPGPQTGATVPNLVGRTLGQALALLNQQGSSLAPGFAIDVFGAVVSPATPGSLTRLVIMQSPSVGARVSLGTTVDMIIAGQGAGGGNPQPPPAPTITRTETATGTPTTTFRVGDTMAIVGTNFSVVAAQNTVTFDGVPAASVSSDPSDPSRRLLVGVPNNIPDAPADPDDPSKSGVVVAVSTGGASVTTTITVAAPPGEPQPQISGFTPTAQFVGSNVTINGANFSTNPSRNIVRFGTTNAQAIVSATATQIVATVPNFSDLPVTSGATKLAQISVTVTNESGGEIGTDVAEGNFTAVRP
ncbi:MAG TPA: IPT/TIG domain-containing protein [Longimicrobium sp.]|nr:IPT/TIG domain-containing protein [Longimicrobium sp.]